MVRVGFFYGLKPSEASPRSVERSLVVFSRNLCFRRKLVPCRVFPSFLCVDFPRQSQTQFQHGENVEGSGDTPAPPDTRWVSRFVQWGLQGILRCRCWGVVVKVRACLPQWMCVEELVIEIEQSRHSMPAPSRP